MGTFMLQIFEKGKAVAIFRDTDRRVPFEDILTGAVFGVLAYVEGDTAIEMLKAIFGNEKPFDFPHSVTRITIKLWHRDYSAKGEGGIEPDVLIDLFSGDDQLALRIIVECKWNAGLGKRQAIDQWVRFSNEAKKTWHVFPVKSVVRVERELDEQQSLIVSTYGAAKRFVNWKHCRRCISWFDIARALTRFSQNAEKSPKEARLYLWAQGVLSVLKVLDEKPFEGFQHLSAAEIGPRMMGSRVFWMGSGM
jgi:hypothetical protein